jgi:NAD(P)-dependent dehydrogenase (short-subunit alcohol dehydrogenase family)
MNELVGKVAIVTGGASGLGRRTVERFVAAGAKVVIADVNEASGAAFAATLGPTARFKRTDVSRREDVQAAVNYAAAEFGGLHIMFNNAGLSDDSFGRLLDQTFERFDQVMAVNLLGVMLGTQIAARHMAKNGGGSIINTSSISGVKGGYGFPIYRAAKAGVINFTKTAAIELGEHLIRVNCICPGNIPTNMQTYAHPGPGMTQADADRVQTAILAVRMGYQPLKRQGTPDDIAETAMFLGGDQSKYITGQIISVDAGATAGDARSQIQDILDARAAAEKGWGRDGQGAQ